MYTTMFQGNQSLSGIKMNRNSYTAYRTQGSKQLEDSALQYVKTIKTASKNLSDSLKSLSGAAFTKKAAATADTDTVYAKEAVEKMVKNYNDLYAEAAQKTDSPKAQSLAVKMVNISKVYSGSLSNIGIGFDSDGRMKLDAKQLDAAAQSGKLQKFFTENAGKNYGFTNQLAKLANNVSQNTSNYVSSKEIGAALTENFAYSGFGEPKQYKYMSSGLLFDYMF